MPVIKNFLVIVLLSLSVMGSSNLVSAANCGIDFKNIDTYSVGFNSWSHTIVSGCAASSAEIELYINIWTFNDYGTLDLFCSNTTTFDYGSVTTAPSKSGFIRRITRTATPDPNAYYTITSTLNATQRGWLNDNGVIYFALIGYPYYMYGWPAQFDLSTSVLDTGTIIVSPSISVTPESLSVSVDEGLSPASQSFEIWNSGGGTLAYSISDNAAWLFCTPVNGSSTGEKDTVTVTYDTAFLAPGNYSGTITISDPAADNSPRTIPVALTVLGSTPDIAVTPPSFQVMAFSAPFDSPGSSPMGLAFDGTHLWHADSLTDKIYKLDQSGTVIDSFDSPGYQPSGLAFDGSHLWHADTGSDQIYKLSLSGTVIDAFPSPGASPTGLAFDGTHLWLADYSTDLIYRLDRSGIVIDSFDSPGPSPMGLAFDGTYLRHCDNNTDMVYKLDLSGNIIDACKSPAGVPSGLAFDGTHLWHADYLTDKIYQLNQSGKTFDYFKTPGGTPTGLTSDGTFLWSADASTDMIYMLDNSGTILDAFDSPGTYPTGLAFDGDFLWHTDANTDMIYKLDWAGTVIDAFSSPGPTPFGLAFDGTYLWHADYSTDRIYKLDLSGTVIEFFNSPSSTPRGLAFDGSYLWHADALTDKVYKMDLTGQVIQAFDVFGLNPAGLAFDGTHLWLADSSADMVRKFYSIPGPVEIGRTETVLFTIQNTGDAGLEIDSPSITGSDAPDFTITDDLCSGTTLVPEDSCTLEIAFSPNTPGEKSADLEIPSNDQDTPILVVPLDSTALGFNPDLDRDGDTDGKDLAAFIPAFDPLVLEQVALAFGR